MTVGGIRPMSLSEVLQKAADLADDQSVPMVVAALAVEPIYVPLARAPEGETDSLPLILAEDKFGRTWVYVYSSEHQSRAAGRKFVLQVPFAQLRNVVDRPDFGGIVVDSHKSTGELLIHAEDYRTVSSQIARAS